MQWHSEAAEFLSELGAFFPPLGEIGRGRGFIGRAREDEVGDIQVAGGADDIRRALAEFAAEQEGGLADFVRGAGVAQDGGIRAALVDYDGVVPDFWHEGTAVVAHDKSWQDDEGVHRGDQEAPALQVMDAAGGEVDALVDLRQTRRLEVGLEFFGFEIGELLFLDCQHGIRALGLLRPAVARLRKEENR